MWQCTHNFPFLTPLCNVVPLLELTVRNSKHPNFHLSRGGRVTVCFVLQNTIFNDIVHTVLPPIFWWRIVNPLFTPLPPFFSNGILVHHRVPRASTCMSQYDIHFQHVPCLREDIFFAFFVCLNNLVQKAL